ncbi:MAG TPA: hypothetical protein VH088_16605, partial [Terriglobales bacterium]|nr:hypothetical protein [Terriglobales bacterium]
MATALSAAPYVEQKEYIAAKPRHRILFRVIALAACAAQTFASRNVINPDGRSYLEIARAILANDWSMVITGHWGTFYPLLSSVVLGIFRPCLRFEFPLIHLLNFVLFAGCLFSFEFFWKQVLAHGNERLEPVGEACAVPENLSWILGYTLFLSVVVPVLPYVTPDILLSAEIFLAAGVSLQTGKTESFGGHLLLGFLLGLGYLTKAILFPMGLVFLGLPTLVSLRKRKYNVAWASLVFLALCTPQIVWLSHSKGHFTFSDSGKLTYDWYAYDLPNLNWQGEPAGSGVPRHPTRQIYSHPDVFEFNGPIRASYPPWHDPSYWNEGMSPRFQLRRFTQHGVEQLWLAFRSICHPR